MTGRSIFSSAQELSTYSVNASSSTTATPSTVLADVARSVNDTERQEAAGRSIAWLGTFDPADAGVWVDSGLLLVFGGIPWQVGSASFPLKLTQDAESPIPFQRFQLSAVARDYYVIIRLTARLKPFNE